MKVGLLFCVSCMLLVVSVLLICVLSVSMVFYCVFVYGFVMCGDLYMCVMFILCLNDILYLLISFLIGVVFVGCGV